MNARDATVRRALSSRRFALIGAGQLGQMSLDMWPADVPRPEFVLDSVKRGSLSDLPIRDLRTHTPSPEIVYLLSAFKLPARDVKAIFNRLEQDLILTVYDLFEHTMPHLFGNGWRNLSPSTPTKTQLQALTRCFSEEQSILAAEAAIAWRYRRELEDNAPTGLEDEKYNLGLFGRAGYHYDCVFDCGSYDLGLLVFLKSADISFGSYIAFEPDPACLETCATIAAGLSSDVRDCISLRNEAVCDMTGFEPFLASGLLSARLVSEQVSDAAIIQVPATTLDAVSHDLNVIAPGKRCLIKLHIEGAELRALSGAIEVMDTMRADLLINLSHNEKQFLEVPAILARRDRFDFYLRSHSLFGEGLTLFARHKS